MLTYQPYLNNSHTYLDVRHPADNAIRRKMVRKWKNAKNVLNGGRYADIVKKRRLERSWNMETS